MMKKPKIQCLIVVAALAASFLAGCASVPKGKPEVEAKLTEAADALDYVNRQSSVFYDQLGSLIEEIKQFCGRPGWLEFEQILLEYPALRDPDSEIDITPEIEKRLSAWGGRWNASGEQTLVGYHDLLDKCIILEAKRLALRERLLAVQAKYIGATMLEYSTGSEKQAKEIYSMVELLDKTGAELNSFQTDDLGLYKFR